MQSNIPKRNCEHTIALSDTLKDLETDLFLFTDSIESKNYTYLHRYSLPLLEVQMINTPMTPASNNYPSEPASDTRHMP